ncbi:MAG: P-loop NTPase [Eggerthellaceae bacterium]|nr:P-loop NTPase [Eggerthellaceae bacterium]
MSHILLCADSESVRYPECLGLDGESLEAQEWLDVITSAHAARSKVAAGSVEEIWVAGSDEVDAINLAAAHKGDGTEGKVCLLVSATNGSVMSRAKAARIDEVWDRRLFVARYRDAKSRHGSFAVVQQDRESEKPAAPALPDSAKRGHLIGVVGAGGGVGKSSVAVVAAYLCQSRGYRTALVDADLQFGDIAYLSGRDDALALDDALGTPSKLDAIDCRGRQPAILAAPSRLERSEELSGKIPGLIDRMRQRFDVVVVNTSPAWSDLHLHLLESGGSTLFLIDQRPSSIRSCKHALQLCARCGVATQPIVFALNRCSRQSLFSVIDVTGALQGAHVVELADGGRDVEELLGTGAPNELIDSGNALCQSVARMLDDLLPAQQAEESRKIQMPTRKRTLFSNRRKRAVACL